MINYTSGDVFKQDVEALVNTVNCVGVMGRGIALQFKKSYPKNFTAYAKACKTEKVAPGSMFVFETGQLANPKYIINFPTKRHWRGNSRIEDIESGLIALKKVIAEHDIKSIAIPPLGSGLGGLNWADVKLLINDAFATEENCQVLVFEPRENPNSKEIVKNREVPKMTAGRAALVALMERYVSGLLDPFVSLIEVHKLMYFLQEAGEPLRLSYKPAHYGPYAENLRHVLNAIEGHMVSGYADGGDSPTKKLELVPGAEKESKLFLKHKPDTLERLERVSKLLKGFESPFGLELLATIHWVVKHKQVNDVSRLVKEIHTWNTGKLKFTERQIVIGAQVLAKQGWIINTLA